MSKVRPKKHLGQHFLKDLNIAKKIASGLSGKGYERVIEIGPGTGVLTRELLENTRNLLLVEVDRESIDYLLNELGVPESMILEMDFLKMDLTKAGDGGMAVIGNFPYNISSQIFFKILENRNRVEEVVCMIQREVAVRIATGPGSKDYGILSVLLQAFYKIEYLFTVSEKVFHPPPKVKSGVIRLTRNNVKELPCDEKLFFRIVKQAFQTRRKTLRNALKSLTLPADLVQDPVFNLRAEQLSVNEFINLTCRIDDAV